MSSQKKLARGPMSRTKKSGQKVLECLNTAPKSCGPADSRNTFQTGLRKTWKHLCISWRISAKLQYPCTLDLPISANLTKHGSMPKRFQHWLTSTPSKKQTTLHTSSTLAMITLIFSKLSSPRKIQNSITRLLCRSSTKALKIGASMMMVNFTIVVVFREVQLLRSQLVLLLLQSLLPSSLS